ncbi:6-bladed beta-propeller [uncultured Bacteroides sp.]|uniref:6-bladed beta-propeller n=1 Tax=uncultured Bacteroides sp. TaxID=162156 RepID=UPI002AA7EFC2|nr:6-bladed beta-propeller [uncultured Bacteroides sp.]
MLYVIIPIMISCSGSRDKDTINVAEGMNKLVEELFVQNVFSDIEYIPLETNNLSLVGQCPEIAVLDSVILISSANQNLKLFDRITGRYIRDIGHVGTDPEGYAKDSWGKINYWIDNVRKIVYFLGWHNDFLLYGFDGNYKGKVQLPDGTCCNLSQNFFLIDSNKIWGHNKLKLSQEMPSVFCIDKSTMSLAKITTWNSALLPVDEVQSVSTILGGYVPYGGDLTMATIAGDRKSYVAVNSPSLWIIGDTIKVKQAFNDTIYTVSEKGLTPYKVFELGKWHWDEERQLEVSGCEKKIAVDYVLENVQYIYFHFHTGLYKDKNSLSYCGFYDKKTENVLVLKGDSLLDKEANQHIQIRGVSSDGSFIGLLQTDELSKKNLSRMGVKEDANPIVAIFR